MPRQSQRSSVRSQSLLERLRASDTGEKAEARDPLEERINSIKASLVRLLNARKGGSGSEPNYGLSDFNDASVGSSDMFRVIKRDIQEAIATYEPRVDNVVVVIDAGASRGLALNFRVSMTTRISHRDEQVTINMVLREGRKFVLN